VAIDYLVFKHCIATADLQYLLPLSVGAVLC
jgi:hypothetical protein